MKDLRKGFNVCFIVALLVTSFVNCSQNNKRKSYYKNGELKKEFFINEEGIPHGEFIEYYPEGNVKIRGNYNNGKKEGDIFEFYPNGDTLRKVQYFENKPNGRFIEYFRNGIPKMKARIKQGETVYYVKYDTVGEETYSHFPSEFTLNNEGETIKKGDNICINCVVKKFDEYFETKLRLQILVSNLDNILIKKMIRDISSSETQQCFEWSESGTYVVRFRFIYQNDTINDSLPIAFKYQ